MNRAQGQAIQGDQTLRYAAIYCRVSTETQGQGFSIPTQIEASQQLAAGEGCASPYRRSYRSHRILLEPTSLNR